MGTCSLPIGLILFPDDVRLISLCDSLRLDPRGATALLEICILRVPDPLQLCGCDDGASTNPRVIKSDREIIDDRDLEGSIDESYTVSAPWMRIVEK